MENYVQYILQLPLSRIFFFKKKSCKHYLQRYYSKDLFKNHYVEDFVPPVVSGHLKIPCTSPLVTATCSDHHIPVLF